MLKRLFSKNWVSGNFTNLLEHSTFYIAGSNSPLIIISGPSNSGKTTLSHNIIASLCSTGLHNFNTTISVSLKNEEFELQSEDPQKSPKTPLEDQTEEKETESKSNVFTLIDSLYTQSSEFIEYVENDIDISTKQQILQLLTKTSKKITAFQELNEIESFEEVLSEANKYLQPLANIKPLANFSEPELFRILSEASLKASFNVISTCLFNINIESSFGSETSELLINVLLILNKFCLDKNRPTCLLRIDDTHLLYMDEIGKEYLVNFVRNLLKFKGLGCLLLGNCQFGEVLKMIKSQNENVAWMHLENYSKDSVHSLYEQFKIDSKTLDQELLWTVTGGNVYAGEEVSLRLNNGQTLEQIKKDFLDYGVKSFDKILSSLTDQEESLKQKIFGASNDTIRAFVYFLTNFLNEPDQKMKINLNDFSLNPIIEGLVVYGLLTYNPINETLTFDKPILSEILKHSTQYAKYSTWMQQSKNKQAYEDILADYSKTFLN